MIITRVFVRGHGVLSAQSRAKHVWELSAPPGTGGGCLQLSHPPTYTHTHTATHTHTTSHTHTVTHTPAHTHTHTHSLTHSLPPPRTIHTHTKHLFVCSYMKEINDILYHLYLSY